MEQYVSFSTPDKKTRVSTLCTTELLTGRLHITSEFLYLLDKCNTRSVWNEDYIFGKAFNVLIPASCTSFEIFGFEINARSSPSTMTDDNKCVFMVYPNITAFVDSKRVEMDYEIETSAVCNGGHFSELIIGNISSCSSPRNAVFSIQPSWL